MKYTILINYPEGTQTAYPEDRAFLSKFNCDAMGVGDVLHNEDGTDRYIVRGADKTAGIVSLEIVKEEENSKFEILSLNFDEFCNLLQNAEPDSTTEIWSDYNIMCPETPHEAYVIKCVCDFGGNIILIDCYGGGRMFCIDLRAENFKNWLKSRGSKLLKYFEDNFGKKVFMFSDNTDVLQKRKYGRNASGFPENYVFELTPEEHVRLEKWHRKITAGKEYAGAIGGDITLHITPTSIGELVTASCRGNDITIRSIL